MVARHDMVGDARRRAGSTAGALFLVWRRWVSVVVARARGLRPRRAAVEAAAAFAPLGRSLRDPRAAAAPEERRALAVAGLASLAAGSVLSLVLAGPLGIPGPQAAIATAWTLGWALLRLGILRLASPRLAAAGVGTAWAGGLLPELIAFTDPLRLFALAASAWLTLGTLQASGASVSEARRAVAWAYGTEAGAVVVRWIAGALLLYLLVG